MTKRWTVLIISCLVWQATLPFKAQAFADSASQTAWTLFAQINQPQADGKTSKWETWGSPADLFPLPTGTPAWPSQAIRSKEFEVLKQQIQILAEASDERYHDLSLRLDPSPSSEVHYNCPAFATVVANNYWYSTTSLNLAATYQPGTESPIQFPQESIVVKAKWRPFVDGTDNPTRFHVGVDGLGKKWVLIGFHMTSRILPNWLWATWEHMDNAGRPTSDDDFGFTGGSSTPSVGLAQLFKQNKLTSEWNNYRLDGPQVDYLSPKLRGNSAIEGALLPTASCMTCHSRAALTKDDDKLTQVDGNGNGYTGKPLASWFNPGGSPPFMQTAFLWSLVVRPYWMASPTGATPPDCSKIP
jgi:hypothetical protein